MTSLALLSLIIATAALFGWVSSRLLRLPITIGTMLLTAASSVLLLALGHHYPALQAGAIHLMARIQFADLILHGMLGLLLFAGAFLLDLDYLFREKLTVALLAMVGTPLSTLALGWWMHWILPHAGVSASWTACLLFSTLISPTDPIAVLEMLGRVGVPKNIQAQLAGESLFNDGVAAVLFLAVLHASQGAPVSLLHIGKLLLLQSGGGLALGVVLAWMASHLMRRTADYQIEILFTLALAMGGYAFAEFLSLSAPLEAVAAGLALRQFNRNLSRSAISHESLDHFWEAVDKVQNAVLFVLLGLEVLAIHFTAADSWPGVWGIVGTVTFRFIIVALLLGLLRLLQPHHQTSVMTLSWGGLRGGLSIALALSIPKELGAQWILPATYLVVIFSIVVQGGSMDLLLRRMPRLQNSRT